MVDSHPIRAGSVSEIAYERIRSMIADGTLAANARLHQGDLATSFAISRTSLREALHRLTAESLVDFRRHHGFFVAPPLRLDAVLDRIQVRLILEPGIARSAAQKRNEADVTALRACVDGERHAESPRAAHDLSREFHFVLARSTGNPEFVRILSSLWTVDIGRQLLARRVKSPEWKSEDADDHAAITEAVAVQDTERAAQLMQEHLASAYWHWKEEAAATRSLT